MLNIKNQFISGEVQLKSLEVLIDYNKVTSTSNTYYVLLFSLIKNVSYSNFELNSSSIEKYLKQSIYSKNTNQLLTSYLESKYGLHKGYFYHHFDCLTDRQFIILYGLSDSGSCMDAYSFSNLLAVFLFLKDLVSLEELANIMVEIYFNDEINNDCELLSGYETYLEFINFILKKMGKETISESKLRIKIISLIYTDISKIPFKSINQFF